MKYLNDLGETLRHILHALKTIWLSPCHCYDVRQGFSEIKCFLPSPKQYICFVALLLKFPPPVVRNRELKTFLYWNLTCKTDKKFNNLGSEKNKTTSTEYKLILDTLFRMNYFMCMAISFYGSVVRQLFKRLNGLWAVESRSYWTYTLSSLFCKTLLSAGGEATDRVTEPVNFF